MVYEDRVSSEIESKAIKAMGESFDLSRVDSSILVTFHYEYAGKRVEMEHLVEEFSCLCPFSNLPDFARIKIRYIPDKKCIELKSFKYYLLCFRQVKVFHEHVVNKILEDLVAILDPLEMDVIGSFNIRGGILTEARAGFKKEKQKV